jgi:hypothetical protein
VPTGFVAAICTKHWHGTTLTAAVTHMAILEPLDGKGADFVERVSNDQYPA